MERDPDSHKGDNGSIAIVGGSRHLYGAPIFAALAAEQSGCDLMFLSLPSWHEMVAKNASLNFIVHPFTDDDLHAQDVEMILELLATMDSAVIGPGIARSNEMSMGALEIIIEAASCPLVLDAAALNDKTLKLIQGRGAILTPHRGELEQMGLDLSDIGSAAADAGAVILLKGQTDMLALPDGSIEEIAGGNAGLTVGGTGDVLAGLIGGLLAQGMESADATRTASTILKKAGDELQKTKGYAYTACDVIELIPSQIMSLTA